MFCCKCGAQLSDESQFCNICGAAQSSISADGPRQPASTHAAPQQLEKPNIVDEVPQASVRADTAQEKSAKKINIKRLLIIGISALLIISLILVLWLKVFTVRVFLLTEKEVQDKSISSRSVYKYDSSGNLLKHTTFLGEEKTSCREYEYDKSGNLVSEYYETSTGKVSWEEYTYDSKGHKESRVSSDGSRTEYSCDSKGNVTEAFDYDSGGSNTRRTEYSYDDAGNLTYVLSFSGNIFDYHLEYEYDKNGNQTEKRSYDSDGNLKELTVMEYDSKDNFVLSVSYYCAIGGQKTERYREEHTYDKKGNITESFYYETGSSPEQIFYEYDRNGHLKKIHYGDESARYTKVTCDKHGNPIKETRYDSNGDKIDSTYKEYQKIRVSKKRAKELQEEHGEEYVIIDKGWF